MQEYQDVRSRWETKTPHGLSGFFSRLFPTFSGAALAVLVTASVASAQVPPPSPYQAGWMSWVLSDAAINCGFRINRETRQGITVLSVADSDAYERGVDAAVREIRSAPSRGPARDRYCANAWRVYGPDGSGNLER